VLVQPPRRAKPGKAKKKDGHTAKTKGAKHLTPKQMAYFGTKAQQKKFSNLR